MSDFSKLLKSVCTFAEDAGKLILKHYIERTYTVSQKSDKSPVTEADWEAHLLLATQLNALAPYPVISEESHKKEDTTPTDTFFWLVDPLDGTKEFIRGTDHFTVNVALLEGEFPVLGVIYVPVTEELFFASRSHGAFKQEKNGKPQRIHTAHCDSNAPRMFVSRNNPNELTELQKKWSQAQFQLMGSSLKYCRIAEGVSDIYIRHSRTYEWDTAAAQCILEEAGGILCDLSGKRLHYRKEHLTNSGLFALGDQRLKDLVLK